MDLFNQNSKSNLLPYEGNVIYYGPIFSMDEANAYYQELLNNIRWMNDQAVIFGKIITTKRKVAWYGDEAFPYTYSKTTKTAFPWTEALLKLKKIAEQHTNETYNSCLLNLYHDGSEGMTWHSDGEKDLKQNGSISSISFGAVRKFAFKHKTTKQKIDIILDHGSLLEMKGETQTYWLHRLPPTKKVNSPRINLTFRTIEKTEI